MEKENKEMRLERQYISTGRADVTEANQPLNMVTDGAVTQANRGTSPKPGAGHV